MSISDTSNSFTDSVIIDDSVIQSKMSDIISNVELLMIDYLQLVNAESLTDITQQQYSGFLMYCAMHYFKPTKILQYKKSIPNMQNANIYTYIDSLLVLVCEYYIFISHTYNKIINPYGYSLFIGCDMDSFKKWEKPESQRPELVGMLKRLRFEYESSLENGAQSGKNPVGFIATLNHRFGWNADNKPQLTVNITRSKNEILSSINPELLTENS